MWCSVSLADFAASVLRTRKTYSHLRFRRLVREQKGQRGAYLKHILIATYYNSISLHIYSCNEHMFYVHIEHDEYTIIVAAYYAHIFMDMARSELCPQCPMQQEQQP